MERVGWESLELAYDPADRTRVRLDGRELGDGSDVSTIVARLGREGWEMVSSAQGPAGDQVLWFKRPTDPAAAREQPPAGERPLAPAPAALRTVTLLRAGNSWFDPTARAQLIAALQELTGQSGWRIGRMVDKAPRVVADGVTQDEADRSGGSSKTLGATVAID